MKKKLLTLFIVIGDCGDKRWRVVLQALSHSRFAPACIAIVIGGVKRRREAKQKM